MASDIEQVKYAVKLRLYCHLPECVDNNLSPIPFDIEIHEFAHSDYSDTFLTNFLEYNKITLADKNQSFNINDSIIACKIPEFFPSLQRELGFAFKAFLPPRLEKIEFLSSDDEVLFTKQFSIYDEQNTLINADTTFAKWFIYSIAQKLTLDEEIPDEVYNFEYSLHEVDPKAHTKDIVTLPMQLDNRSLAAKDSIYYALYDSEINTNGEAKAQVVNGNLITNSYRLFYLGNNIYDGTDEITTVVSWAQGQYNTPNLSFGSGPVTITTGSTNNSFQNLSGTLDASLD